MLQIFGDVLSLIAGLKPVRPAAPTPQARRESVWRRPAKTPRLG